MSSRGGRSRPDRGTRQSGFSLVEVLLSMAILGIVITGFLATYQTATRDTQHQYRASQAVAILDSVTEQLLLLNPEHDNLTLGTHQQYFNEMGSPLTSSSGAMYQVRWDVTATNATNIRAIELTVRWTVNGIPRTIRWTTWRN